MFRWIILMIFYLKKKCCFPRCTNDYVTKKYPCYAQGRGNASDLCSEGDLDGIWRTMRKLITQGKQKVVIKTFSIFPQLCVKSATVPRFDRLPAELPAAHLRPADDHDGRERGGGGGGGGGDGRRAPVRAGAGHVSKSGDNGGTLRFGGHEAFFICSALLETRKKLLYTERDK